MLLLAATFERFVRDMAALVARSAVETAGKVERVPTSLLRAAWKRTFEAIGRAEVPQSTKTAAIHDAVNSAESRADALFSFLRGNVNRDIYDGLVRNDMNMRVAQINDLFSISSLSNVCSLVSKEQSVIEHFNADTGDASTEELRRFIDGFIEKRNNIMHALSSSVSAAPTDVCGSIESFKIFAQSLCDVLEGMYVPFTGKDAELART